MKKILIVGFAVILLFFNVGVRNDSNFVPNSTSRGGVCTLPGCDRG